MKDRPAYLIGRNLVDRNWPKDGKYGNVLCVIAVRPYEIATKREVMKAALKALIMALRILITTKEQIPGAADENYPWMCTCGYEGEYKRDRGVCPVCHGYGVCPWNG